MPLPQIHFHLEVRKAQVAFCGSYLVEVDRPSPLTQFLMSQSKVKMLWHIHLTYSLKHPSKVDIINLTVQRNRKHKMFKDAPVVGVELPFKPRNPDSDVVFAP